MAEYQDILKFLASNPPNLEQEKKLHASLLEMLAKKLRGEETKNDFEPLKRFADKPNYKKGYH
ncbi:MAG: hypothetical protein P8Y67_09295 [Alphaproteobacteria bacterium]